MPSTYSTNLRLQLMANGENSGTWGTVTNSNLETVLQSAIAGLVTVPIVSIKQPLTIQDNSPDQARNAAVRVTTALSTDFEVYIPPVSKLYVFFNDSAKVATVYAWDTNDPAHITPLGNSVVIPAYKSVLIRCDGTNVVNQLDHIVGAFSMSGALTVEANATIAQDLAVAQDITVGENFSVAGNSTFPNSAVFGDTQTATVSIGTPSVVSVTASPPSFTAIVFSTTGTLPTGITAGTTYYVSKIDGSTFNFSADPSLSPLVTVTVSGTGTQSISTVSLAVTPPAASNNTQIATTEFVSNTVTNSIVDNRILKRVNAATTGNITLSGTQTIDGVAVIAGDRVLVKDQLTSPQTPTFDVATETITVTTAPSNNARVVFTTTGALPTGLTAGQMYYVVNRTATTFQVALTLGGTVIALSGTPSGTNTVGTVPAATNGIYEVNASTWTRTTDANTAEEIAATQVAVLAGTVNGGRQFTTNFKSTNTLGTTVMEWGAVITATAATGTSGQVLTTDGTVSSWQAPASAIGVGQTWQAPTRVLGTTYTNSTGKPIMVSCSVRGGDTVGTATAVVDAITVCSSTTTSCCGVPQISFFPFSFIVPNGSTYRVTGTGFSVWAELR